MRVFVPLSIPSPSEEWRILFQWEIVPGFTLTLHAYAICILVGIIAASLLTSRRLRVRGADPGLVLDVGLWAVVFGIAGGRIFHVLTHPDDYFGEGKDLWKVFAIWEGGLAIFGALLLGAVGVFVGCRLSGLRFWTFADALVPGLLLAQAFGRFGNYFNQELFGLPTDAWFGLQIDRPNTAIPLGLSEDTLFLPTFLFEVIWNLIGVFLLILAERRYTTATDRPGLIAVGWRLQWGRLLGLYLVWYGTGRMFFESIRIDPSEILLGVRVNVWAAFAAVVIGLLLIVVQGRRHPGVEPSPYVPGHLDSDSAGVDSDDTYPDVDDDDDTRVVSAFSASALPATSGVGAKP